MHPFRIASAAAALALTACALVATPAMAATSDSAPAPTATPTSTPTPTPTTTATPTPTPSSTPTPAPIEPSATALDHTTGHSATHRWVHLYGSGFSALDQVLVDGVPAEDVRVLDDSTATFLLDIAPDYQPGTVVISLVSADGTVVPTPVTFTYKASSGVDKQMAYAFSHWNLYSSARFGYIPGNDCVDFTSQTLLARGWKQSSQWYDKGAAARSKLPIASATWVSSTAMSNWLHSRPDLAVHLGYNEADRDQVVVGDIVQFDWDSKKYPGVWQHTGVVSRVVRMANGHHDIYYAAHTNNRQYGGSTQWLAQNWPTPLRIQFWHLKK